MNLQDRKKHQRQSLEYKKQTKLSVLVLAMVFLGA
jgi:hypothetical protein